MWLGTLPISVTSLGTLPTYPKFAPWWHGAFSPRISLGGNFCGRKLPPFPVYVPIRECLFPKTFLMWNSHNFILANFLPPKQETQSWSVSTYMSAMLLELDDGKQPLRHVARNLRAYSPSQGTPLLAVSSFITALSTLWSCSMDKALGWWGAWSLPAIGTTNCGQSIHHTPITWYFLLHKGYFLREYRAPCMEMRITGVLKTKWLSY